MENRNAGCRVGNRNTGYRMTGTLDVEWGTETGIDGTASVVIYTYQE